MSTQVASIEFHDAAPDAQHASAVKTAEDFLVTVTADPATPAAVVDYARQRLAALTAQPAPVDAPVAPAIPAPVPATFTVNEDDLTRLIESAQAKLQDLKAQGYVIANRRQEEQQISAVRAAIAACDKSISHFDQLIVDAVAKIDELIEQPVPVAMFGQPMVAAAGDRVRAMGGAFAGLRVARHQQRVSRQTLAARLADLERVEAQSAPKPAA
jgi:hypothetical protein